MLPRAAAFAADAAERSAAMIHLDVRTISITLAAMLFSLVAARFFSRRAYRSVPGYQAWLVSDTVLGAALVCLGLRHVILPEKPSVIASVALFFLSLELRDLGVRQFLGLTRQRLATILPDLVALILIIALTLQGGPRATQVMRFLVVGAVLTYITIRTTRLLFCTAVGGLRAQTMVLGTVTALTGCYWIWIVTAVPALAREDFLSAGPSTAAWFLILGLLVASWSLMSFGVAGSWLEQRRVEAMDRFRLLLEESPIPTMVLAAGGGKWIETVNRRFVEATGYSLDDLPDEERWWALTCREPGKRDAAQKVWHEAVARAAAGEPANAEARELVLDFRNQPSRTLELHARRVGEQIILQLVDVSLLKAAMQAREEILAVVSHDLKSPVSAILLRVEALLRKQADPLVGRTAMAIRQSASTMDHLIHDLLDITSLDAGRLHLDLAPTDLAQVIAGVVEVLSPLASRNSTRVATEILPLREVTCDKDRVARVLANLVGNSIKFTKEGTITIRAEPRDDGVLVSVADTGCGIAPEVLPHVFEHYFTTARGRKGTGLGLYIARGIVEAHGGRIWATSEPGKGSTFSFTLPRSPADLNLPSRTEAAGARATS
jgi:signal transduction histidine kinase